MSSSKIIKAGEVDDKADSILVPRELPAHEEKALSELGAAIHKQKIQAAQNQASQLLERVNSEKEDLLQETQKQVEEILQKAKADGEKLLETARQEEDSVRQAAKDAGRQEGYDDGFQKGIAEGVTLLNRLDRLVKTVAEIRLDLIEKTKLDLARISINIAHAIIRKTVIKDPSMILRSLSTALEKIRGKDTITIRINPSDLGVAENHLDSFYQQVRGLSHIDLKPDTGLESGGAIIETDLGRIDATVRGQLETFQHALSSTSIQDTIHLDPLKNPTPPAESAASGPAVAGSAPSGIENRS